MAFSAAVIPSTHSKARLLHQLVLALSPSSAMMQQPVRAKQ